MSITTEVRELTLNVLDSTEYEQELSAGTINENELYLVKGEPLSLLEIPQFTYTGNSVVLDDGDGNWRIKFLTSGTLTFLEGTVLPEVVDVFLVGGGGNGRSTNLTGQSTLIHAGGGGGYTKSHTYTGIAVGIPYDIVVGNAGESSSMLDYMVSGGDTGWIAGTYAVQPAGSSNGGSGGSFLRTSSSSAAPSLEERGGVDGADGVQGTEEPRMTNNGQGYSTREFWELDEDETATLYASGGSVSNAATASTNELSNTSAVMPSGIPVHDEEANTGNGGSGVLCRLPGSVVHKNFQGGSGIVILRNHRTTS